MKEKILTAKEWLQKGFAPIKHLIADEDGSIQQEYFEECMEKYANYKTKMLEAKILQFRQSIKNRIQPVEVEEYDEYFGICTPS